MRFTLWSVLGSLGISCYILADTFFVSKGTGIEGLTALNLAIPVYNFIYGTGLMLGIGGSTIFAVCKGQGDHQRIHRVYTVTVALAAVFSALFVMVGLCCSKELAVLLGADETVLAMTDTYLKWLLIFGPAFVFNTVLQCFVRNDESPKLAMTAMLAGSLSNIGLDYLFIFPLDMGIFGAVLATGLSPIISMLAMLPHWLRRRNSFHLLSPRAALGKVRLEARSGGRIMAQSRRLMAPGGRIMALGAPSLLTQVLSGVVMILFNHLILGLAGNTGVAAYGVVANISLVVCAIFTGIAQGVQPLLGEAYGAGCRETLRELLRYGVGTALVVSAAVCGMLFAWAEPVSAVFNSEGNALMQQLAVEGIRLYFLATPFVGFGTVLTMYFTCVEKALPAQVLTLLRGAVLIVPLAFLGGALWGMRGVWLSYPAAEAIAAAVGVILLSGHFRKKTL